MVSATLWGILKRERPLSHVALAVTLMVDASVVKVDKISNIIDLCLNSICVFNQRTDSEF
jgi:hypothetical protein